MTTPRHQVLQIGSKQQISGEVHCNRITHTFSTGTLSAMFIRHYTAQSLTSVFTASKIF
jgi:hypothetical protein